MRPIALLVLLLAASPTLAQGKEYGLLVDINKLGARQTRFAGDAGRPEHELREHHPREQCLGDYRPGWPEPAQPEQHLRQRASSSICT
jgi:hypothetical protein